jgi:hypothetical protein
MTQEVDAGAYAEPATSREVAVRVAVGSVLALALALLAQKVLIAILDPSFAGDAGIRMNASSMAWFRLGNRVWLPYLQLHIRLFNLLRAPYRFYNLIPCFYFFVAVVSLGLLGLRLLGRTWSGILFTLAVMFCFAENQLVSGLATTLYQEVLGAAFFYLLLYAGALDLGKARVLVILGALALLTRDTFQFYLLSLTLLNWKTIFSDGAYRRSFLFLWAIPVMWLLLIPVGYLVHDGRLPRTLLEWPLMINKEQEAPVSHLSISFASLWTGMVGSRAIVLLAFVVLAWVVILWKGRKQAKTPAPQNSVAPTKSQSGLRGRRRPRACPTTNRRGLRRFLGVVVQRQIDGLRSLWSRPLACDNFGHGLAGRFGPFSLLSLGMIYTAIALFNPTRATFGNSRMAFPLIEHLFVWALLALAATFLLRGISRYAARVLVMAGLLVSLSPLPRHWVPQDNAEVKTVYPDLERLVRESSPNATPVVCFGPENLFETFSRFVAPTLYAKRRYLPAGNEIPKDCSVWISRPAAVPRETGDFEKVREYQVRRDLYYVYRRRVPAASTRARTPGAMEINSSACGLASSSMAASCRSRARAGSRRRVSMAHSASRPAPATRARLCETGINSRNRKDCSSAG